MQELFEYFYNTGGVWIFFFIFVALYPKRICTNRRFILSMFLIFMIIATYAVVLLFSTMDLTSHLRATGRILLIPSIMLLTLTPSKKDIAQ